MSFKQSVRQEAPLDRNVFVLDYFIGASGTDVIARAGEIGATWTYAAYAGATNGARLSGDRSVYNAVVGAATPYASGLPPTANFTVGATIQMKSAMIGVVDGAGLYFRMAFAAETTYTLWYNNAVPAWQLYRTVAGVTVQIGANVATNIPTTTYWPYATLGGVGTSIRAVVGGTQIYEMTDAGIADANRAGFRLFNNAVVSGPNAKLHISNFSAWV